MLWSMFVVLLILWWLIHLLFGVAVVVLIINLLSGRLVGGAIERMGGYFTARR